MMGSLLICCALLGVAPGDDGKPAGPETNRAAYEQARREAGRDAGAHLRLALWCEEHGMDAERMKHLALAVLHDPSNALARSLMGLVAYKGKWTSPDEAGRKMQEDPEYRKRVDEYLDRRARTPDQPEAQMKLAAWCRENGLKAQAVAHYHVVVRLDPSNEKAWKQLGYRRVSGRWVRPEEAASARLEADRQRLADRRWKTRMEKLREGLTSKDAARRLRTERAMDGVDDPRAVPMIWSIFVARGNPKLQAAAVRMLGQIDGPPASMALATLAILLPEGTVRARAVETLIRRDPRDVADRLISLIRKPFTYTIRKGDQPGTAGELLVEGETFNVRRVYRLRSTDLATIPAESFSPMATTRNGTPLDTNIVFFRQVAQATARTTFGQGAGSIRDSNGDLLAGAIASTNVPESLRRDRQIEAIRQDIRVLRERLADDILTVDAMNADIRQLNDRVLPIVTAMTGKNLGAEPEKWKAWWTDQQGYAYQSKSTTTKPTFTEFVDSPSWSASLECFGAGTLVHTIDGPRAIESIRVGDRVLSQDTTTGSIDFQPVLAVHQTRMAATVKVVLDGETLVATGIHRFWKAGKGWVNARDLKPGDRVRALGAVVNVKSVEASESQPVYNLDVAGHADFLVGKRGLLVHDASVVQPVLSPFDRPTGPSADGEATAAVTPPRTPSGRTAR